MDSYLLDTMLEVYDGTYKDKYFTESEVEMLGNSSLRRLSVRQEMTSNTTNMKDVFLVGKRHSKSHLR